MLEEWGITWHVSFEPTKTHSMVVFRKSETTALKPDDIQFMGKEFEAVAEMELVGCIFDPKMSMVSMIDHVARKTKKEISAIMMES